MTRIVHRRTAVAVRLHPVRQPLLASTIMALAMLWLLAVATADGRDLPGGAGVACPGPGESMIAATPLPRSDRLGTW